MPVLFSVTASDPDGESLQGLTRQLCQALRDKTGIESSLGRQPAGSGTKGDFVTAGQILIVAVGAGGPIAALISVLKAGLARTRNNKQRY